MIAPFVTISALLINVAFYSYWSVSILLLPVAYVLLITAFRSGNRTIRWWVLQYLGVSSVCFSAAAIGALLSFFVSSSTAGWYSLVLAVVFCAWGIFLAHDIRAVPVHITSSKIGRTLRVVQISDVHIGSRKPEFLQKVIDKVCLHSPDLLVITGDLIDANTSAADMTPLSSVACPVVYCSGNHERYINYAQTLESIASHGVTVLHDKSIDLLGLRVMGIADRQERHEAVAALEELGASLTPQGLTSETRSSPFTMLLYHQPDIWEAAKQHGIELMLSGHTHNGQIWPFGWLVRTRYPHVAGHFQASLSHLFVSQGTGTWGPLMRFGTRCEMTIIDLQSA